MQFVIENCWIQVSSHRSSEKVGRWSALRARVYKKAQLSLKTRAMLAKSLHGLRKSSGVVSCIAIDSVPMVSYYVLYSNCVCKMCRFGDNRLL